MNITLKYGVAKNLMILKCAELVLCDESVCFNVNVNTADSVKLDCQLCSHRQPRSALN